MVQKNLSKTNDIKCEIFGPAAIFWFGDLSRIQMGSISQIPASSWSTPSIVWRHVADIST